MSIKDQASAIVCASIGNGLTRVASASFKAEEMINRITNSILDASAVTEAEYDEDFDDFEVNEVDKNENDMKENIDANVNLNANESNKDGMLSMSHNDSEHLLHISQHMDTMNLMDEFEHSHDHSFHDDEVLGTVSDLILKSPAKSTKSIKVTSPDEHEDGHPDSNEYTSILNLQLDNVEHSDDPTDFVTHRDRLALYEEELTKDKLLSEEKELDRMIEPDVIHLDQGNEYDDTFDDEDSNAKTASNENVNVDTTSQLPNDEVNNEVSGLQVEPNVNNDGEHMEDSYDYDLEDSFENEEPEPAPAIVEASENITKVSATTAVESESPETYEFDDFDDSNEKIEVAEVEEPDPAVESSSTFAPDRLSALNPTGTDTPSVECNANTITNTPSQTQEPKQEPKPEQDMGIITDQYEIGGGDSVGHDMASNSKTVGTPRMVAVEDINVLPTGKAVTTASNATYEVARASSTSTDDTPVASPEKPKSYFYSDPTLPTFKAFRDKNRLKKLFAERLSGSEGEVESTILNGDVENLFTREQQEAESAAMIQRDFDKLNQACGNKCIGIRSGVGRDDIHHGMQALKGRSRPLKLTSIEYRIDTDHSPYIRTSGKLSESKLTSPPVARQASVNGSQLSKLDSIGVAVNNTSTSPDLSSTSGKQGSAKSLGSTTGDQCNESFVRRYSEHVTLSQLGQLGIKGSFDHSFNGSFNNATFDRRLSSKNNSVEAQTRPENFVDRNISSDPIDTQDGNTNSISNRNDSNNSNFPASNTSPKGIATATRLYPIVKRRLPVLVLVKEPPVGIQLEDVHVLKKRSKAIYEENLQIYNDFEAKCQAAALEASLKASKGKRGDVPSSALPRYKQLENKPSLVTINAVEDESEENDSCNSISTNSRRSMKSTSGRYGSGRPRTAPAKV